MLTYNLQNRGSIPIYEFLYNCIRDDIRSGRLQSGSKLPSKREFAADNGVALITVENAYAQLVVEGYVDARERRGYFVADIEVIKAYGTVDVGGDKTDNYQNKTTIQRESNFRTWVSPAAQSFPYNTWTRLMRRIISEKEKEFASALPSEGIGELREAIASYLLGAKNLQVNPDNIIIGPGTEYLHSIIIQLIGRNRFVAIEDPGYKKVGQIYESNGIKVLHIPMDEEGIDVDKLQDSNVKLVHTSPAHQFPTGVVMSAGRRHRLLQWAMEQNAYIIEDDYDSEFRFKGRPLPTLTSLNSENLIYMNTFTGTLAPSIRVAYIILPDELMNKYREKLSFLSGTVSGFEQYTLAAFISEGYYERHINRMRNKYRKVRELYKKALDNSKLGKLAKFVDDSAGLQMILEINNKARHIENTGLTPIMDFCYKRNDVYSRQFMVRLQDMEYEKILDYFNGIYEAIMVK